MKKTILILLLFCGILFSCEGKADVRFEIKEDITIELDEYSSTYDFKDLLEVYRNDEKVPYNELTIYLAEGSSASVGEQELIVSYKYKNKEYTEVFKVKFIDSYSTVSVHMLNDIKLYRVEKGDTLESLDITNSIKDYNFTGFYKDKEYRYTYDSSDPITEDIDIYGRFEYPSDYTKPNLSMNEIATNLDNYIDALINATTSYKPAWNQEGFKGRWNYIDGVFLNSVVNLYYETNAPKYKDFFINYINYYIDADGDFIHPETREKTGYRSGELDSVCESRILFDAYEMTKDERYLKAISKTYSELMSMPIAKGTDNFSHKQSYLNQIWLDGMYMYVPFLARYAKMKDDTETFHRIKTQYQYIRNTMFDAEKKLYYHGHDTTKSIFWADKTTGNSKNFWLRSNGWFIVSLVDVLEYYPEGEDKEYLKGLLVEAVEGILQYKDEKTNMFYQLMDRGPTAYLVHKEYLSSLKNTAYGGSDAIVKNYLESSGSSMVAYTLLKGSRLGFLKEDLHQTGKDVFEGVYGYSYKEGSLNNICITAGLGPDSNKMRDGSIEYYLAEPVGKDDAKGVGPFLMAYLEYSMREEIISEWHTVNFIRFDASFKETIFTGRPLKDILETDYPGYTFEGYYFDDKYDNPIPEDYRITENIDIYLYYKRIPTVFEILCGSNSVLLKDDFDSYSATDSLPQFQGWGEKGIYYHINDKNEKGVDLELNHIELGDGTAFLFDDSENNGTQLILDSGNITSGLVKGYMEVKLYRAGNQWTFFQMYGTRTDGTYGEIFGARFEQEHLQYRVNQGAVQEPEIWIYPFDIWYIIEYEYDLNQKKISVKINGDYLVKDFSMETANSFGGIKIVTSDGLVHNSYGEYFHRMATVDNVVVVVEE